MISFVNFKRIFSLFITCKKSRFVLNIKITTKLLTYGTIVHIIFCSGIRIIFV